MTIRLGTRGSALALAQARLVAELLDSSNPFACPHGRPVIVDIKHVDIEKHFHRR